jgi:hypothetical protein
MPPKAPSGPFVKVRLDKRGCTGMFWRNSPSMHDTSNAADWPRNGAILDAVYPAEHPGWVQFSNGYWMPTVQDNIPVIHSVDSK